MSAEVPKLVLLCGYAGHGKDTFLLTMLNPKGYRVYRRPGSPALPSFEHQRLHRIAFADQVKVEMAELLGVPLVQLEMDKNKPLDPCHVMPIPFTELTAADTSKTYRSCLVEYACAKKRRDPYYWCRQAFDARYETTQGVTNVVTDFRFPEELEYAQRRYPDAETLVIRLHRPGTAIADISQTTEHALDGILPDYVVASREGTYELLVSELPYVESYALI